MVGNKSDLQTDSDLPFESLEATALFDWENGFVQCSAKQNLNIKKIFKELLNQAKPRFGVNLPNGGSLSKNLPLTNLLALQQKASKDELHLKRRQSLPIVPAAGFGISAAIPDAIEEEENSQESEEKPKKRRSSFAALRRESCKIS